MKLADEKIAAGVIPRLARTLVTPIRGTPTLVVPHLSTRQLAGVQHGVQGVFDKVEKPIENFLHKGIDRVYPAMPANPAKPGVLANVASAFGGHAPPAVTRPALNTQMKSLATGMVHNPELLATEYLGRGVAPFSEGLLAAKAGVTKAIDTALPLPGGLQTPTQFNAIPRIRAGVRAVPRPAYTPPPVQPAPIVKRGWVEKRALLKELAQKLHAAVERVDKAKKPAHDLVEKHFNIPGAQRRKLIGQGLHHVIDNPEAVAMAPLPGSSIAIPAWIAAKRKAGDALKKIVEQKVVQAAAEEHPLQGHTTFQGISIDIENRKGSVRKGKDKDGKPWRTVMKVPYGYIKDSTGADDEEVDCYVGPTKDAPNVYVVHQKKSDGTYDEDKCIFGVNSKAEAKALYLQHYNTPKFLGPIKEVPVENFKEQLDSGKKLEKISEGAMTEQDVMQAAFLDELEKIGANAVMTALRGHSGLDTAKAMSKQLDKSHHFRNVTRWDPQTGHILKKQPHHIMSDIAETGSMKSNAHGQRELGRFMEEAHPPSHIDKIVSRGQPLEQSNVHQRLQDAQARRLYARSERTRKTVSPLPLPG